MSRRRAPSGVVAGQPYVQWVLKISKQCNLRCTYCYEYPFLGDRDRMQLGQLERMFAHIAEFYRGSGERMDFVWHGGEPLLVPPDVYRSINDVQRRILGGAAVEFTNSVQTNLTRLTDDVLELLGGFFGNVGVSIDLFGGQRVNSAGAPVERRVVQNMQRLKDEKINFGCITVLSRVTAPHVVDIYRFFEDIDTGFRLLPIYRAGYEGQQEHLALTDAEIVEAFKKVVDHWLRTDSCLTVLPIQDYVTSVVRRLTSGQDRSRCYNKLDREIVYIIDTDGSVYSNADAYDVTLRHGNIFEEPLDVMRRTDGYHRAVKAAHERMEATCATCRYFGACSGYFMAEATPEQRWTDDRGRLRCGVAQPVQAHIERRLAEAGLIDAGRESLAPERLARKLTASACGAL